MNQTKPNRKIPIWLSGIIFFVVYLVTCLLVNPDKGTTNCLSQAITVGTILTIFFWWNESGKYIKNYGKYLVFIWLLLELVWTVGLLLDKKSINALKPIHFWLPGMFNLLFVLVLFLMLKKAQKAK